MLHEDKTISTKPYQTLRFWILFFFHALVFTVPLFFTWINEELFEFNKLLLVYGFTLLIGGLWVGRMIIQKKLIWKKTFFDFPIILFFISQLISTVFSINMHTSLFGYYTRFNGGLLSVMSYIVLYYAFVNNVEKDEVPKILFSTFFSALLVTFAAIPEHFGHSLSCLLISTSRGTAFSLDLYTTSCWIQDVQTRVFATFGQPNWLAAYAITLIPLGVFLTASTFLSHQKNQKLMKWFYAFTTFCLFLTLLFTKSRSGFLGFVVATVIGGAATLLSVYLHKKETLLKKSVLIPLVGVILSFVIAVLVFGTPFTPSIGEFAASRSAAQTANVQPKPAASEQTVANRLDEGGTDSGEIRRIVWQGALKVWQRYPFFGSGVETFAYSYYQDRPLAHNLVSEWDFLYNKAHNEFLNYLATTGIFGLGTYLLLLLSFFLIPLLPATGLKKISQLTNVKVDEKHLQETSRNTFFGIALVSGIVGLAVSNFFGFSTVMVTALLFLYPALWVVASFANPQTPKEKANHEPLDMTQIVCLCILFFFILSLLFSVYEMWEADRLFAAGKQQSQSNKVNVGLPLMEQAVQISPGEPYFYEELAVTDARIAAAFAVNQNATASAEFAKKAITNADQLIQLNSANPNYFKSQARIYSLLAQLDPRFLQLALQSLQKALVLAPTDPKVMYNIALIQLNTNNRVEGIKTLEETIKMKSNYLQARLSLAAEYEKDGKIPAAKEQYQYILKNIQNTDPTSLEKLRKL